MKTKTKKSKAKEQEYSIWKILRIFGSIKLEGGKRK